MNTVLVIDTAFQAINIAIVDLGANIVYADVTRTERGQAEWLIPNINKLLSQNTVNYGQIDLIAVTVGPGSFTGLRVGIAAARGFGLALGRPVQGVCTLDALAETWRQTGGEGAVDVIIDTRRDDVFHAHYAPDQKYIDESQINILAPEDLDKSERVVIGDGLALINREVVCALPDPSAIAKIAGQIFNDTTHIRHAQSAPVYARGAEVSQSKKLGRVPLDPLLVK